MYRLSNGKKKKEIVSGINDNMDKYVDTVEYCKNLEKHGFKYNPLTKTLFLGYPYVPKEFKDEAVKIQLYGPIVSALSKVVSVDYMRTSSPYKKVEEPEEGFKTYVDKILKESEDAARPHTLIV